MNMRMRDSQNKMQERVVLLLALLLPALGCRTEKTGRATEEAATQPVQQTPEWPPMPEGAPVLVVFHDPGYVRGAWRGVELAVWADGFVLLAADPANPSKAMCTGQVEPRVVQEALDEISRSGFYAHPDWCLTAPDEGYVQILARSANERNCQGWSGRTYGSKPDEVGFIQMWKQARAAAEKCRPRETRPVEETGSGDQEVRGYRLNKPYETPWLSGRLWYRR
jgi:hypothetical protein